MSRWLLVCLVAALLVGWPSGRAEAQEGNRFAIGIAFNEKAVSNSIARGNDGLAVTWRLSHDRPGWGWHYGFGWFAADLEDLDAPRPTGQHVLIGEVRVRPLMAGYGYTWVVGPVAIAATTIGGVAITSVNPVNEESPIDRRRGATPVVKPEINCWIDWGRKFGLNINAGYIVARPVVASSGDAKRFRADTFSVAAGLVYKLF